MDVAIGRITLLQRPPREGPDFAPKLPFHCDVVRFTARFGRFEVLADWLSRGRITSKPAVPELEVAQQPGTGSPRPPPVFKRSCSYSRSCAMTAPGGLPKLKRMRALVSLATGSGAVILLSLAGVS